MCQLQSDDHGFKLRALCCLLKLCFTPNSRLCDGLTLNNILFWAYSGQRCPISHGEFWPLKLAFQFEALVKLQPGYLTCIGLWTVFRLFRQVSNLSIWSCGVDGNWSELSFNWRGEVAAFLHPVWWAISNKTRLCTLRTVWADHQMRLKKTRPRILFGLIQCISFLVRRGRILTVHYLTSSTNILDIFLKVCV